MGNGSLLYNNEGILVSPEENVVKMTSIKHIPERQEPWQSRRKRRRQHRWRLLLNQRKSARRMKSMLTKRKR